MISLDATLDPNGRNALAASSGMEGSSHIASCCTTALLCSLTHHSLPPPSPQPHISHSGPGLASCKCICACLSLSPKPSQRPLLRSRELAYQARIQALTGLASLRPLAPILPLHHESARPHQIGTFSSLSPVALITSIPLAYQAAEGKGRGRVRACLLLPRFPVSQSGSPA
jgi:hypothetical protein